MNKIKQYIENIINTPCFNKESVSTFNIQSHHSVEVVIPVYNGFDALTKCLNSVIDNTNSRHKISILDDASTDSRVKSLLKDIANQYNHINIVTRVKNLGYLKNINQHLTSIDSDVILLNADTEVSSNWIEELLLVSNNPRTGIICPASDNATLLSLSPKALQAEKHLSDFRGHWFPIPTAVGFCMLIKNHIISRLGGFDPYFDPGYGEECDYSMRVRELGFLIACVPACLVKHKGSQSFVDQADQLKQQHQKLLDLRWPHYPYEIKQHFAKNPMLWVEQKLQRLTTKRPRVLHVVHGIDNKGGVELFTRDLLSQFSDRMEHTLLIPTRSKKAKTNPDNNIDCEIIEIDRSCFPADNIIFNLPADLNNPEMDRYFSRLLKSASYNSVHFHSLVGMGSDIWPLICHNLKIPYVISLHDHKGLCPIFSLSSRIDDQEIYCGKSKSDPTDDGCLNCIKHKTQKTKLTTQSYIQTHSEIWQQSLSEASHLIFASEYLNKKYLASYPNIRHQSVIFEPAFYPSKITKINASNNDRLQLAFLGQFGILKGAQLFIDLYHELKAEPIDFHIIGGIDPKFDDQLEKTSIILNGSYDRSELPERLKSIDLIVLTSQIPETYGLTLTEAWLHGIPVIAPDVGAYSSRVINGINGFLYQNNQLQSARAAIYKFIENQSSTTAIKSIDYHANNQFSVSQLENIYQNLCDKTETLTDNFYPSLLSMSPPKTSAFKNMKKWLDAPLTFEAEGDWLEYKQPVLIIILGSDKQLINSTKANIQSHLSQAVFSSLDNVNTRQTPNIKFALLIESGNHINDNVGNWIDTFEKTKKQVSTSDYALISQQQEIYAPHFSQRFSWHNHCLNNQISGCVLININRLNFNDLIDSLKKSQSISQIIADNHNNKKLVHFPYFSYLIFDQNWVKSWKNATPKPTTNESQKRLRVCLILESNLIDNALNKAVKQLKQQSLFKNHEVTFFSQKTQQIHKTSNELKHKEYDLILMLRDNICLKNVNAFENLIRSFAQDDLDAATIPSAREQSHTFLIGKKLGAAPHIHGIGPIHDQTFDCSSDFFECDLLDDDLLLIKSSIWPIVQEHVFGLSDYFQSFKIATKLRENEKTIGMFKPKLIFKKGIPSQPKTLTIEDLKSQRKALINKNLHLFDDSLYSPAYSNRNTCQLQTKLCLFKTPKILPRVIAFTPENWASDFYRVKSPVTTLAAHNLASVIFMPQKQHFIPTPYEIHQLKADALLLHGFYSDKQLTALNQYRKQLPIEIIISIDDLLTEIPQYNPLSGKIPEDVSQRIKLACSLADTLLVSTQQLAIELGNLHQNIKVIPNRLSKSVWQTPIENNKQRKIRIGWAGAGQHLADLAWLKKLVEQTQSKVQWVFFGDKPEGLCADSIEFHSPVDFNEYAAKLTTLDLDIGIAPLVDNRFNAAKSNLKLIEYAALSIPVIASDVLPYQNSPAILLPNDIEQWKNTITTLGIDENKRLHLGQQMHQWLNQNYWLEDHLDDWIALLGI